MGICLLRWNQFEDAVLVTGWSILKVNSFHKRLTSPNLVNGAFSGLKRICIKPEARQLRAQLLVAHGDKLYFKFSFAKLLPKPIWMRIHAELESWGAGSRKVVRAR